MSELHTGSKQRETQHYKLQRRRRNSSIHHPYLFPPIQDLLEPIPALFGRKAGYTLDRSPVQFGATRRETTMHIHTHSCAQFIKKKKQKTMNLICMSLGGSWSTWRKPTYAQRTCKLHTERPLLRFELGTLLLWGNSANHQATEIIQFNSNWKIL